MGAQGAVSFRPFTPSAAAYAELAAIFNAAWPDEPRSAAFYPTVDRERPAGQFFQRHLVAVDGKTVGFGELGVHPAMPRSGYYDVRFVVHPDWDDYGSDGLTTRLYRHLLTALQPQQPICLLSWIRDNRPARVAFLAREGFQVVLREPSSRLDLAAFDPARHAPLLASLAADGIELTPLSVLQADDPDWEQKLYDVDWAFRRDMPSPYPRAREPLDLWRLRLQWPGFRADGHFVAVDRQAGGLYVGASGIGLSGARPGVGITSSTGVRRRYRRRGIARALKVRALAWARDQGLDEIITANEENNPMYRLNLDLGFATYDVGLLFEKRLEDAP